MSNFYQLAKKFPEFNRKEIDEFIQIFKSFDLDGSGSIDENELEQVMKQLGEKVTKQKVKELIKEVDLDGNGMIEFDEFLQIIKNIRSGKSRSDTGFGAVYTKQAAVTRLKGTTDGSEHSFADDEKISFVDWINMALKDDPHVGKRLPISPNDMSIFEQLKDGIILCKLINDSVPDTIDTRVINTGKVNKFQMIENQNLAINSAKAIGCNVVNIGQQDIMEAKVHLLLGLLWQIIRIGLLSKINLNACPELYRLLEEGETLDDLMKLSPDQILLRWMNYHLKKANSPKRVRNFASDIRDSEAYTIILHQLMPNKCNLKPLQESDLRQRAEYMLQNADNIGCRKFVSPGDVVKGNSKLNLAFVANLFNHYPGLEPLTEEEKAALDEWLFKSEGDREARVYSLWMNSIGVEPFVNNLFLNLRDGLVLLQVFDHIQPGIVDWKRVNRKQPLSKFKALENTNYCVELGKKLKFSLVGIAGSDIYDGNKTLTLALVWQLMRFHVVSVLKKLSKGGKDVSDQDIVRWANQKVAGAGKQMQIRSFKDPAISNGHFFLYLVDSIRPGVVNYDLMTPGDEEKDALMNAKYVISIARKIGATIFLLPEDIYEVKPKMIMTLAGSLMAVDLGVK
ncbi:plastin-3 [Anaeramoeba ignava]|uniref:Fimbrin n=1 Tax=Anaeramoeba ignava TaxID=1746090 RepID=A0A9Q0LB24_ANAIG|nr:plastin-3 [Anaeramoeba ignava]|eukprot:Anaeramoba_ignava/a348129_4109.p1 GENE.a348129_4109~~a348129_4109.p1  ORF type:complete len:623 (+),score=181.19 a348129_4109:55-1923(+)